MSARLGNEAPGGTETRRRIVETAERLFRQYGFQKTTVADIAAELSMSPANVYRFFASKSEINEAVASLLTGEVEAIARAAATTPGLPAPERLALFVHETYRATVQRYMADKRMHAMVHAAIEESWDVISAHKMRMDEILVDLVRDGASKGEFVLAGDVETAARCVRMAVVLVCHPQLIEHCMRGQENIELMIDPLVDFCCRALGSKAVAHRATS